MKKAIAIEAFHPDGLTLLAARPDIAVEVVEDLSFANLAHAVTDADIIMVRNHPLTEELLAHAEKLVCVAKHGVGVEKIDVAYLTRRGIPVLNSPGSNAVSVAEQTLALILAVAKNLRVNDLAVRNGNFAIRETRNTSMLHGKKILICGFGFIGRTVAGMCAGFGMGMHFYDPFVPQEAVAGLNVTKADDLHAALKEMDIVSLHLPMTDRTKDLIDAEALSLMRPDAILISAARGGVVNEAALYDALKNGRIAGAGLDVFEKEPTPTTNPLLSLDNVVVSPHNAALSREGAQQMGVAMARNVIDFLEGTVNPAHCVNRDVLDV